MKHPFDAVEHISPEELTGLDGQELVSKDALSEAKQDRIYQKALAKIGPSQTIALPSPKQRTWKKWVAFLIAAVVVVFSSFSVVAEVFHWDYRISNLFDPTEEQMISYQGMNIPVMETVQDKGVSVSFGTAISDGYNLYLPATITPPKDFPENHYCMFLEPHLFIDGQDYRERFQIEYPPFYAVSVRDGRFPILIKLLQSEIPLSQKKIDLSFEGLVHSSDVKALFYDTFAYEENDAFSYIDGVWKTSFTIADQQQYMREYQPKQTITYARRSSEEPFEMTVESVTVSPLSFRIILSTEWNPQDPSNPELPHPELCGSEDLKLLFKDGTSLAVNYLAQYPNEKTYMNYGTCLVSTYPDEPPSTRTCTQMDFDFKKFIDINEVEAVIIGDNVIPLT